MEQWSVSFWTILPMTVFDTKRKHVLLQNIHGSGAYVQISENIEQISCICEETGRAVSANYNLREIKRGWHNISIVCNNVHKSG